MRRAAVAAGALVAALAPQAQAAPRPPLATVTTELGGGPTFVTRLDPRTLEPVGRSVNLMEHHGGWDYSPDGSMIAFGKSPAGGNSRGGVHIVRVRPLRRVGIIDTSAFVGPLAWLRERRLVGLIGDSMPFLANPITGRTLRQGDTGGCSLPPASVVTGRALVWLSSRGLVTGDARGSFRVASIGADSDWCAHTGLALDESHDRAWIVESSGVISVDLRTMRARRRTFPAARVGTADHIEALWLGRGRIAAAHTLRSRTRGVEIISTRTRTRRTVDRRAGEARFARGTLLTFAGLRARSRIGVRGHSATGRRRYQLLRGENVSNVQVAGRYAWAIGTHGVVTFEVRSGRVVSRSRQRTDNEIELLIRR